MNVFHILLFWGFMAGANCVFAIQGIGEWPWLSALAVVTSLAAGYFVAMKKTHGLAQSVSAYIKASLAIYGIKNPDLPHEKKELRTP